jgi:hypothetical protein
VEFRLDYFKKTYICMMHQTQLNNAIEELLLRDHFVGIPGFGGLMLKSVDATLNHYTFELKPTHSHLIFNAQLDQNDGQLAHLISLKLGVTYKEALSIIEQFVIQIKQKLEHKKYATFHPFGNFFLNEQGAIFFVGRHQFNLHLSNYGLQPLKWEKPHRKVTPTPAAGATIGTHTSPISLKEEQEEATVISYSEDIIHNHEAQHRVNQWFNIAASFVLISVSALALTISTMTWIGVYQNSSQYASMNGLLGRSQTSPVEEHLSNIPEHSADFIFVDGKIIPLNARGEQETKMPIEPVHENSEPVSELKSSNFLDPEVFKEYIFNQKGQIFLVGGTYITEQAAKLECNQWIKNGNPAFVFKPANSSFYRIVLGRFNSKEEVNEYSVNLKEIQGITLSMTRWNLK